ncbi:DMT family transporter [Dehalobacter sp. DCM]|uniref:DMT family transporter n=1 Tax=Dehalobacter sp. DCM TaxID=2907827 RepID=UPI0030814EA0|nr:DMT family transporter [Dehalobacter sp. DCM]
MSSQKSNVLLLLAALIWGLAFVAQRVGMEHIGPFTFNGVRFALGALSLLPLMVYFDRKQGKMDQVPHIWKAALKPGLIVGLVLFCAASLQQIGLIYTEAGKAAFVTGLYMVFVPIVGYVLFKQRLAKTAVLGTVMAVVGLYFLSVKTGFEIERGDLFELCGSLFWTAHILIIDAYVKRIDALRLAFYQFIVCSVLCMAAAVIFETITWQGITLTAVPILYGGICSVGVAYTLQIVGQKYAKPSQAAIVLSMETLFAGIGGYFILNERLGSVELLGCVLMFAGMLLSQIRIKDTSLKDSHG